MSTQQKLFILDSLFIILPQTGACEWIISKFAHYSLLFLSHSNSVVHEGGPPRMAELS